MRSKEVKRARTHLNTYTNRHDVNSVYDDYKSLCIDKWSHESCLHSYSHKHNRCLDEKVLNLHFFLPVLCMSPEFLFGKNWIYFVTGEKYHNNNDSNRFKSTTNCTQWIAHFCSARYRNVGNLQIPINNNDFRQNVNIEIKQQNTMLGWRVWKY